MADKTENVKKKLKKNDHEMKFRLLKETELYLHQGVASGTLGDEPYDVTASMPGNSIIVNYRGKRAMLDIKDIVGAGLSFIDDAMEAGE